ncbi:MAG: M36 family metallopeptidase [Acidobacteriia bacterium]|nr:M36 family metallopeptidase [Terriglobia bacterium]
MNISELGRRNMAFITGLFFVALAGGIRLLPGTEQGVDVRRLEATAADRAAISRRTAEALKTAARQLGTGFTPSFSESGRLRALARFAPPLSAPDLRDAEMVGREFAAAHLDLLGLDGAWLPDLELAARDHAGRNTLLRFRQQWAGIPVFQSDLRIHITPAGEVVEVDFQLESLPPPANSPANTPSISPESALLTCIDGMDPALTNPRRTIQEPARGPRRRTTLHFGPFSDEVTAQWVWFPAGRQLRLAWHFDAVATDGKNYYECVVDATDGTLLYRNSITDTEITGLVFDGSSPQPSATPGVIPPKPDPPDFVTRVSMSFAGDPTASPIGWVGPDNETIGNNVIVREDKAGDNEKTLGATAKATDGHFDFDLQLGPLAPSPVNFTEASLTSLFFWCNLAHDYFYKLGFTEPAGNFQEDNFSKGGVGQDSVRVDAQDGIDLSVPNLNNASMSTPEDGSKPRMSAYLWGPLNGPYVDCAFDAEVVLHEYTHGVFRRLTPAIGGVQGGAMNEGDSDFFSLNYLVPASASPDGSFTHGGFSKQDFLHGTRSRPYSTDLAVNDLSYADFGHVKRSGAEVHADGEIWVEGMWELRARLIKKFGYEEGRRRVAQLMIDAMKRAPANPSYVDMRDALLAADQADQAGADANLIWESFARRGMGFMAVGGTGSTLEVLPSQDLPSPSGKVRFFENVFFIGETVRVYVGDSNNAEATLTLPIESTGGDSEALTFTRSGALYQASILSESGTPTKDDGKFQVAPGDTIRVSYRDVDDGSGRVSDVFAEAGIRAAYDVKPQPSSLETLQETRLFLIGDNLTRLYSLPFGFPFYNRLIDSVYISTNGLITIGIPVSSGSSSQSALKNYSAIAPLWMDLRTTGNAVTQEDVYVSNPSPDSMRFRWAAETVKRDSKGVLIAGTPVQFAVTLFENGDIVFDYGSGNTGLTPTVGISRRADALAQIYAPYSSSNPNQPASLDSAPALHWAYPGGGTMTTTIFPFLDNSDSGYTGLAVANYGDKSQDVLFSAQQDNGQAFSPPINPESISLTGGAQAAVLGQQLFPSLPAQFSGWVEARSTDSRLAAFFVTGDNAQTYLSGALTAARPSRDLIFTHITAADATSGTSLYLVNPGGAAANVQICWYDSETSAPARVMRTLEARSRLAADVSTLFPSLPENFKSGYLRITSDTDIAGVALSQGNGAPCMIMAQEPSAAATQFGAQFASGYLGGIDYETQVSLVNTSDSPRTMMIELRGNDGLRVSGPGITNPKSITLASGGQLHLRGDVLFGLPDPIAGPGFFEGTLVLAADGAGVVGDVTFGEAVTHQFAASLPLDAARGSDLIFAQVAEGGDGKPYFTGVAMFNPNANDVTVRVQVFQRKGIVSGTADLKLKSNSRISRTLDQLVPGLNQIGGYVRVTSTGGPIAGFAVYGDSTLDFLVAIPPQFISR